MARSHRRSVVASALHLLGQRAAASAADPVERVKAACATSGFQRRFSEAAARAGDAVTSMRDVQQMAHAVLDEMGVDHRGVFLTFAWDPKTRGLGIFFRPVGPGASLAGVAPEQSHP